jgi:preprotein translocase subunit SecD
MLRTATKSLILTVVLTLFASLEVFAQEKSPQELSTRPTMELRIASTSPAAGRRPMKIPAQDTTFYVSDSSFVSDKQIVDVRSDSTAEGLVLHVQLTPEGSSRMAKATSSHVGERGALIVDSRLLSAPLIVQRVEPTRFTAFLPLPKDVAREVAATIATRWPQP